MGRAADFSRAEAAWTLMRKETDRLIAALQRVAMS